MEQLAKEKEFLIRAEQFEHDPKRKKTNRQTSLLEIIPEWMQNSIR